MNVFIGSSGKQLLTAIAIIHELSTSLRNYDVTFIDWDTYFRNYSKPNRSFWDVIESAIEECEAAIMLWAGDDQISIGTNSHVITRDNVILETGAFLGKRGRDNVFILFDNSPNYHHPTDLKGLCAFPYNYNPSDWRRNNSQTLIDLANALRVRATLTTEPNKGQDYNVQKNKPRNLGDF